MKDRTQMANDEIRYDDMTIWDMRKTEAKKHIKSEDLFVIFTLQKKIDRSLAQRFMSKVM